MQFDLGYINKITVVNVNLNGNNPTYSFVTLKQKKDEIDFVQTGERIHDLKELIKAASNKHPFLLHFSGKGILNRKTKRVENYRHNVLLNANMNSFYFTDYLTDSTVFSSVIRKDVVQDIVQDFKNEKCQVISVSSGPFVGAFLNEILDKETLIADEFELIFEKNEFVDFSKLNAEDQIQNTFVNLGEQRVSKTQLCPVSIGATFFNPTENIVLPEDENIFLTNRDEAKQKNIFARFGMIMMVFFLVALFSNFVYLGQLNQQIMEEESYLAEFQDQLGEITRLEDERNRKERLLKSSGLLNRNFLSFYLMELGNSIPKEIVFDEIIIRPLKKEIKQRRKIEFREHLILLNGRSKTSNILSNWIEEIEEFEWLTKVDILDYSYLKNEGVFELEMIVL